ncbi:hypothetical protein K458DRAFT_387811 [Lentithecium fluviatile CBS 122367]|uniref:Uncharacterized protein n=1 Tax=Lentithecium fluviatile CBS 122367 TaxID=1168545 RepID=A0A6G1J5Q0_9PLEO|nr:hypothetical protein K458DRAFT_387811 [Lentithecium fluviatile CBS 122367]
MARERPSGTYVLRYNARQTIALFTISQQPSKRFLASQFYRAACASTIYDPKTLVDKISPTEYGAEKSGVKKDLSGELALKPRVMWILKESDAKKLSARVKVQCERITNATDQILLECGLFMEKQLVELRDAMPKQSKPIITSTQSTIGRETRNSKQTHPHYHAQDQTLQMSYFSDLNHLSDSAYWGNWNRLLTRNLAK